MKIPIDLIISLWIYAIAWSLGFPAFFWQFRNFAWVGNLSSETFFPAFCHIYFTKFCPVEEWDELILTFFFLRLRPTPPTWNLKKGFLSQKNKFQLRLRRCKFQIIPHQKNFVEFGKNLILSVMGEKLSGQIQYSICPFVCPKCPFSPLLNPFMRFWA